MSERCLLCVSRSSVQYASCLILIPSPPAAAHQRRKLLLSGYIMSSNIHKRYADRAFVASLSIKQRHADLPHTAAGGAVSSHVKTQLS